jgi:hypothetical protein
MWKNTVEPERPEVAVWCMHIAGWITKATNTHSEYVYISHFHCNSGSTHARVSMLPYTYIACPIVTDMDSVHCAVRTASLTKSD